MESSSTDTDVGPPTEELPQGGGRASGGVTSEQEDRMEDGKGSPSVSATQGKRPHATVRGKCHLLLFI